MILFILRRCYLVFQGWFLVLVAASKPYSYEYHNVLLNHFAYKEFGLQLPCKSLSSDSFRSGHVIFNLYCERRAFRVKISAPSTATCPDVKGAEVLRLYLNIRAQYLQGTEVIDVVDPQSGSRHKLTSSLKPQVIEQGLQSYAHVLTTGSDAWLEYKPPSGPQDCAGRDGDSTLLEVEFVLVTPSIPNHIDTYKFTRCEALHGYIPTGILCDQYTNGRPIGCPVNMSSSFASNRDVATGQDRRNLNCYSLVLGQDAKAIRELMDGTLRLAPEVATLPTSAANYPRFSVLSAPIIILNAVRLIYYCCY
ncbi:hypothetical protein RvY_07267 [Ramazzottius varieornatus]|uniref:Uncharacterized protein n=1 Tax=Ramazzottius varieornatus TaxID=947166 RepID=A0A1D1V1H4_RAMVA|nr:hypothetical protein RvY_07267 [Ramazzottius varieornatus]